MLTSGSVSQDSLLSWTQLCWMHKHNMQQISSCNICKMLLNDLPTGSGSHAGSLFFLNSFCPHRSKCLVATLQLQLSRILVLFHLKFDVLKYLSVRKETRETSARMDPKAWCFLILISFIICRQDENSIRCIRKLYGIWLFVFVVLLCLTHQRKARR